MNKMFERNLPPYLAHDLDAWKKGVEEKSRLHHAVDRQCLGCFDLGARERK